MFYASYKSKITSSSNTWLSSGQVASFAYKVHFKVKAIHYKDIGERSRIEKILWHAECHDVDIKKLVSKETVMKASFIINLLEVPLK